MEESIDFEISTWHFTLIKTLSKQMVKFPFRGDSFVGDLDDRSYNILKDYHNKTLKNVNLDFDHNIGCPCKTVNIQVQITVPYTEKIEYYIELNRVEKEVKEEVKKVDNDSFDVNINNVILKVSKKSDKFRISRKIGDDVYLSTISEGKYKLFQDYKNKITPDITKIEHGPYQQHYCISVSYKYYDIDNTYNLYLFKQTIEDKLKDEVEELKEALKQANEKLAKFEKV